MKMMKSRFFAMAFLALGVVFATACSKDKDDDNGGGDEAKGFAGLYYGSHDIATVGLIVVPDTVTVTDNGDGTISFFSQKLDQSFDATVNGNKATIDGFTAEVIQVGEDSFSGISVTKGTATLNGNKMNIKLNGVTVREGTVDLSVIGGYPLRNITINTYADDPFVRQ